MWKRTRRRDMADVNVYTAGRLSEMARSLGLLARSCTDSLEEENGLTREDALAAMQMAGALVCGGCSRCNLYRDSEKEDSYYLYYLLRIFEQNGRIGTEDMPELFKKDCRRKRDYLEQLNRSFTRASMNLSWKNRFLESRDVVISQFRELAVILEEFSRQIDEAKNITEEYKGAVKKAFRRYHILVDSMLLLEYESGRREIYLTAKTTNGRCVTSKDAAELMESVFPDTTWLPAKDSRSIITRRYETVRFEEKGDYYLSDRELQNIRFMTENYSNCVVLLNTGGVIDLTELRKISGVQAILLTGQTGNMGGHAVADVLMAKTVPSGKLTDTWARSYDDYPSSRTFSYRDDNLDDEYYSDGIYVGYRYFDTFGIMPLYCFGYGKGYTDFSLVTKEVTADEKLVKVEVEVTNIGKVYPGREVVQVYYSAPDGVMEKPTQELAGFAKTKLLMPGEKEVVTVTFATEDMASYDSYDAAWVMEEGEYTIRVGNSSRTTEVAAIIDLDETVQTVLLKNVMKDKEFVKEIHHMVPIFDLELDDTPFMRPILIYAENFKKKIMEYEVIRTTLEDKRPDEILTLEDVKKGAASLEELVAQLTVEEMADLCVGTERLEEGGNVIGSSSACVPGAAGDTTSALIEKRKIPNLILADGPAGLRLQTHFKTDKEGNKLPGGEQFGMEIAPFAKEQPEGAQDYYQYCTAIPIATTLAQSWDVDLIKRMGEIVGEEMEQFHIHLWLAPGMNIHRNPLCGRNFEYYSEDPLLTGLCAAAETKGVQSYKGHGTTIKHFAANNQEDNRMFTNAHISERALREIYLKGFEIVVKTAQPYAIMTI